MTADAPAAIDSTPLPRGNIVLTQTVALLIDAYRELNAKRLFWITLWLSLAVVATFAFVSITPTGFKIFVWDIPSFFNSTIIPADTFYKFLFTEWAIPWWLGVAASILALISVASVFPDFISGGSIDLYLARPIGRLRLFVTKYLTGLLFVAMQVLVFCAASFLVIGVKGHVWEFGIFLAVPLVTGFFSYLYCVCVLMGLITRSTLAAILVTLLFWFGLFALNSAGVILLTIRTVTEERQMRMSDNIATWDNMIAQHRSLPAEKQSAGALKNFEFQRDALLIEKRQVDTTVSQLQFWQGLIERVRAPLPKTDESIKLMNRWLIEPDPIMKAQAEAAQRRRERREAWRNRNRAGASSTQSSSLPAPTMQRTDISPDDPSVMEELQQQLNARSAVRILGSSLAFEVVVLALAAWIFCRRDF
jgi:ABC-type transport system involved in multi-copper enzyme maturation permease subunit